MMNRQRAAARVAVLGILVVVALLWCASRAQAEGLVRAVGPIGMTVEDMDRSIAFYTQALGFAKMSDVEVAGSDYERLQGVFGLRARVVRLRLGGEEIELMEYIAPRGRPVPADSRSHDRWFQHIAIVVSDMDRAYAWLRQHRVAHASSGPQRLPDWNANAGGIRAFGFKDPDGHTLEVLSFPPGKGDPRWQRSGGELFLGIDHTAIVVADTDQSLRFYRDVLGLALAGASENYGPEQEQLNNVFSARLRITTLRAAAGPGIELLEYISPRDGRPTPIDVRANDLIHWQVRLAVNDPDAAARRMRDVKAWFVSPGQVLLADGHLGFRRGALVRDPDGHAIQLTGD